MSKRNRAKRSRPFIPVFDNEDGTVSGLNPEHPVNALVWDVAKAFNLNSHAAALYGACLASAGRDVDVKPLHRDFAFLDVSTSLEDLDEKGLIEETGPGKFRLTTIETGGGHIFPVPTGPDAPVKFPQRPEVRSSLLALAQGIRRTQQAAAEAMPTGPESQAFRRDLRREWRNIYRIARANAVAADTQFQWVLTRLSYKHGYLGKD